MLATESMAQHAVHGQSDLVRVFMYVGEKVKPAKGRKRAKGMADDILYRAERATFFDHTAQDAQLFRAVSRLIDAQKALDENEERHSGTAWEILESVVDDLSLSSDNMFKEKVQTAKQAVDNLLERMQQPTSLIWHMDPPKDPKTGKYGEPTPLPHFVHKQVPFERTRTWLSDQMNKLNYGRSGSFIMSIRIDSGLMMDPSTRPDLISPQSQSTLRNPNDRLHVSWQGRPTPD